MPILPDSVKSIAIPRMVDVEQCFPDERIEDLPQAVRAELAKPGILDAIPPETTAAVLVGSRGIADIDVIVKTLISSLRQAGIKPFIVPSMGSHGGACAEGQTEILAGYGITEESTGTEIRSSMETVIIGETKAGVPIHIDQNAAKADILIPVARVKPHTAFDGAIESGLCKMLTIGLGKHAGCSRLHQEGLQTFPQLIPEAASVVLETFAVPFGLAIVENAHDHTHRIAAVKGRDIFEEEPKLLSLSKSLMPRLCFDHIDVLVVDQIGKDITGSGMDANITGRTAFGRSPYFTGPEITRIVVNRLSEGTHRNAIGIGYADFTTRAVSDHFDPVSTYANCVASGCLNAGKLPIALDTEEEALLAAIHTCPRIDPGNASIVKIRDTLHLVHIQVSENLLPYCRNYPGFVTP